jgi:putative aldouronate transport system substrate-binding protein
MGGFTLKLKKSLILVFLLISTLLVACNEDSADEGEAANNEETSENFNATGTPIVNEEIEIDIFAGRDATSSDNWDDLLIWNTYEEMTNISVNWELVTHDSLDEQRNLRLASGDLPDVFYASRIGMPDLQNYGSQGMFIPLNELIEEYAPNLQALFEEYPEMEKGLTMPDGNIYSLPYSFHPEADSLLIGSRPWIREDWLEQLGMDNPVTLDELYEFLTAVKETDLNGNGENDEIPFGTETMWRLVEWVKGAYGLGNRGSNIHQYLDIDPDDESLRFYPIADEYRQAMEYIHKLYSEELIEQNIYTIDSATYLANASEGLYGVTEYYSPDMLFGEEIGNKYIPGNALQGPDGTRAYNNVNNPILQPGAFVITNANEHPEATIRWIDHFYGEEGQELFFMGVEDETFEVDDNGEKRFVDEIADNPDGLSVEEAASQYLSYTGGFYPSIVSEEYFLGSETTEMSMEAAEVLDPYLPEEVWPAFSYTEEENRVITSVGADIQKYVSEMQAKFITGEESLDDWDKYVQTIEDMGLEEYMEVQNAAYERYLEN